MTLHNVLSPGRRTQPRGHGTGFNERNGTHWGEDLKASRWNVPGDTVYAPADYRVVSAGRGNGSAYARVPHHSGRYVLLDLGIWGGDRMYVYLGHLAGASVRAGDTGKAGDVIARMGGSGASSDTQFIVHLHLGVAVNTSRPRRVSARTGWIDPVAWFAKRGVDLDTSPTGAAVIIPAAPEVSKPEPTIPKEWSDMASKQDVYNESYRAAYQALKDFHENEVIFNWVDSTTGEDKKFTAVNISKWISVLFKRKRDARKEG